MSITAMKQAADQLEIGLAYPGMRFYHDNIRAAITALRTAIEQAEKKEPVADGLIRGYVNALVANKPDEAADATKRMVDYVFATSPAAQRQWVGLTEAEINEWDYDTRDVVMDIEKMLREKNT